MLVPDLTVRASVPELMDDPACSTEQLVRTLRQFSVINRLFARYRTTIRRHLLADMLKAPGRSYHLVDLGAGGGDIAAWARRAAAARGLSLRVTAVDADERAVEAATAWYGRNSDITFACMDAFDLETLGEVDYLFANHFLHHLEHAEAVRLIALAGRAVRRVAVFSDLRRCRFSYYAFAAVGSLLFHRSFAVTDGLISIRKGFTNTELRSLAEEAKVACPYKVETRVPGRLVLTIGP